MRKLLENVLPSLFLLSLVDSGRDEGDEAASPHARATGDNVLGESGASVVDELSGGIETLAAVAEEAGSVGLGVEVEKESAVDHCETAMKDVETVL